MNTKKSVNVLEEDEVALTRVLRMQPHRLQNGVAEVGGSSRTVLARFQFLDGFFGGHDDLY